MFDNILCMNPIAGETVAKLMDENGWYAGSVHFFAAEDHVSIFAVVSSECLKYQRKTTTVIMPNRSLVNDRVEVLDEIRGPLQEGTF